MDRTGDRGGLGGAVRPPHKGSRRIRPPSAARRAGSIPVSSTNSRPPNSSLKRCRMDRTGDRGGLGGRRAPPAMRRRRDPAAERSEAGRFDPGQLHQHVALAARADALDRCGLPRREPPPSFVGRLFAPRTIGTLPLVEGPGFEPFGRRSRSARGPVARPVPADHRAPAAALRGRRPTYSRSGLRLLAGRFAAQPEGEGKSLRPALPKPWCRGRSPRSCPDLKRPLTREESGRSQADRISWQTGLRAGPHERRVPGPRERKR